MTGIPSSKTPDRGEAMTSGPNSITLIFIINGQEWPIKANAHATLLSAVERALNESHNAVRPTDEWEVRTVSGVLLEMNASPLALGLHDGANCS